MAQQEGPFSEYLQQIKITPPVQVPKPTGLEGTGSAIGNIALNFISGLRQGRQQQYMQQEMEEQKKFDAYQKAMERVSASKLPDAEKRSLYAELEKPLIQRIASDPNATSKKTGNPLTDLFKSVASSVAGPAPKKRMNLEMDPVMNALQAVSDPTRQVPYLGAQLDRQAELIIRQIANAENKAGRAVSLESFLSGENGQLLADVMDKARVLGYDLQAIKRLYSETKPKTNADIDAERQRKQEEKNIALAREGLPTNGFSGSATGQAANTPTQSGLTPLSTDSKTTQVRQTGQPPVATEAITTPSQPAADSKAVDTKAVTSKFIPVNGNSLFSVVTAIKQAEKRDVLGNPEEFMIDGTLQMGRSVTGLPIGGRAVNGILIGDKLYTEGFRKPNQFDVKPPQADVDNLSKQINEQVLPLLTGLPNSVSNAISSQILVATKTGDMQALKNIPLSVVNIISSQEKQKASDARRESGSDRQEKQFERRAATTAASQYLRSQAKQGFDQVDMLMGGIVNEPKLLSYLADPKGSKLGQAELTLIDKSLARAAAKATDPTTGVKTSEEEGYNKLVGVIQQFKINIDSVADGKSTLGNEATRRALYDMLANIHRSSKRKSNEVRDSYRDTVSWVGQEIGDQAFGMYKTPPAPTTGRGTPPPAANKTKTAPPGTV